MAIYEWNRDLELGIAVIDGQHKNLFKWIEALDESVKNGDGAEAVGEIIWKLITYVTEHFTAEERMMLASGYPALDAHRNEHDLFVERLRNIQVEFISGHQMGEAVLAFLVDWLVSHIKGTDQVFSRFMREQKVADSVTE